MGTLGVKAWTPRFFWLLMFRPVKHNSPRTMAVNFSSQLLEKLGHVSSKRNPGKAQNYPDSLSFLSFYFFLTALPAHLQHMEVPKPVD